MTAALAENRLWYFIVPQVSSTEVVRARSVATFRTFDGISPSEFAPCRIPHWLQSDSLACG